MTSAWPDVHVDDIVYIVNGAESVELSCGEGFSLPTIGWYKYSSNGWKMIFYYYPKKLNIPPKYYNDYSADKY